jgi:predicted PurR-regulated permease PerM
VTNLSQLVKNFSLYESSLNSFLNEMGDLFRVENITDVVKQRISALDIQSYLRNILSSLTSFVGNIFLVVIYVVFLFLEEVSLSKKSKLIFSDPKRIDRMRRLTQQIYHSTNQYVTLKTYVSLLTGAFSYIILLLYGVDYAFLWAFIIFLLNFIPYIGSFIATFLPAIFAIVQFGTIWYFIWIFGSIQVVQLVVGNYIEPRVMGKSLNLSPLVVVITLSFWGYVWGLLGMFLSVPITSIMLIVLAQFPATRGISVILSENGEIDNLIVKPEESPGIN